MPFGGLLTMGLTTAMGVGKGLSDSSKANRQRKLAAETTRYSPWTGMQAQPVQEADILGSTMQGAMTGGALGQGMAGLDYFKGVTPSPAGNVTGGGWGKGDLLGAGTGDFASQFKPAVPTTSGWDSSKMGSGLKYFGG